MARTTAFLVAALMLSACSASASRPALVPSTVRPIGAPVYAREQGFMLRLPHERWSVADAGAATISIVHARRGARVTLTPLPLSEGGFIATVDVVRREAITSGCTIQPGSAGYMVDTYGRRAVMAARRTVGGDIQDGEITVLEFEGRDGVIVISAWWPEIPAGWVIEDVHSIVDSIRPLPGA